MNVEPNRDLIVGATLGGLVVLALVGLASLSVASGPPVEEIKARSVEAMVAEHHVPTEPVELDGPPSFPPMERRPPASRKDDRSKKKDAPKAGGKSRSKAAPKAGKKSSGKAGDKRRR